MAASILGSLDQGRALAEAISMDCGSVKNRVEEIVYVYGG